MFNFILTLLAANIFRTDKKTPTFVNQFKFSKTRSTEENHVDLTGSGSQKNGLTGVFSALYELGLLERP